MRKKLDKVLFVLPALFLILYSALYSFGMLWFADYYGKYVPLSLFIGVLGVLFFLFIVSRLGEDADNFVYPFLAILGMVCLYFIFNATLSESKYIFHLLGLLSFLAMFVYPFVVKENEDA